MDVTQEQRHPASTSQLPRVPLKVSLSRREWDASLPIYRQACRPVGGSIRFPTPTAKGDSMTIATLTPVIPAAQYLRMSTESQEYSLEFQQEVISSYASRNGFQIVKTYQDPGKSGLSLKHRAGLRQLLQDVVSAPPPYQAILVYDVSRWGRFQDSDEAAHYEFVCRQAGVPIHYCAETFLNDGTMPSTMMKALKRMMAAEYGRELSEKVTLAMICMVKDGLWPGSMPGYGLRRMLVSPDRTPKQQMSFGERKGLRTDRTIIVHGPPDEIKVVKEIFRLYSQEKKSFPFIARTLNDLGIPHVCNDSNVRWTYQAVRQIVLNEKYTGSLIWGDTHKS
jgi:DNA invertase Pin-like site-specific DNA recombinase